LRDAVEYWAVVTVRAIACRLPDSIVSAWGTVLGLTFYTLDRPHRRVALTNLDQCFPNRSARERRAIARATFAHFGQVLLKLLTFSALTPEQMLERS
jgi:lauroyl/myristoyl acyltransferase